MGADNSKQRPVVAALALWLGLVTASVHGFAATDFTETRQPVSNLGAASAVTVESVQVVPKNGVTLTALLTGADGSQQRCFYHSHFDPRSPHEQQTFVLVPETATCIKVEAQPVRAVVATSAQIALPLPEILHLKLLPGTQLKNGLGMFYAQDTDTQCFVEGDLSLVTDPDQGMVGRWIAQIRGQSSLVPKVQTRRRKCSAGTAWQDIRYSAIVPANTPFNPGMPLSLSRQH